MYKRILVPLDGSKRAERILSYVEELALKFESKLILLQVVEPSVVLAAPYDMGHYYDVNQIERLSDEAKGYLNSVRTELEMKGITSETLVDNGPVVTCILEEAIRKDVDLIAMASHGRSGLARAFYGSVAAGILHQADRPLLLIRAQEE
ncbi:MAG TPA: universal stress protein [Caldilineaceae bacterium]|nr:universal stress protein [Caldilineaceae bacterium]